LKLQQGYTQLYTGNGKGKTTAAMGLAVRALGNGFSVAIIQFMKAQPTGEILSFEKLDNVDFFQYGCKGFLLPDGKNKKEHAQMVKKGFEHARQLMKSKKYDLIVLDEIVVAIYFKLIAEREIIEFIESKNKETEIILTGRAASEEIIKNCDLVTEMQEIKHYYQKGVQSRIGIEN